MSAAKQKIVIAWTRTDKGGVHAKAVDRDVDESAVEALLCKRSKAKLAKKFKVADEIAKNLQELGICYLDEKREWYTRALIAAGDCGQNTEQKSGGKIKVDKSKKRKAEDVDPSLTIPLAAEKAKSFMTEDVAPNTLPKAKKAKVPIQDEDPDLVTTPKPKKAKKVPIQEEEPDPVTTPKPKKATKVSAQAIEPGPVTTPKGKKGKKVPSEDVDPSPAPTPKANSVKKKIKSART
ncbi:hypothetical protein CYMTET_51504 [Cymbomonas tetramitiformis]|uniref:Uncharacterized protein n=1 Tax=Cymbomonas tetramitiformis TaxID=36881 RepID=A0AAE0BM56_9CHLO|nr:hypothetical protein CYMTET_51504 [Cymbomonas tetramitiformis]